MGMKKYKNVSALNLAGPRSLFGACSQTGRVQFFAAMPKRRNAAQEAAEVFKAHAGGHLFERPNLACGEGRRLMILAEPLTHEHRAS
jgi:hypothetical protein